MIAQSVGWCGNFCFIYGAASMARRKPIHYAVANFLGNAAYLYQSVALENWSLLGLSCVLGVLNVLTIWNWRKHDRSSK